MAIITAAFLLGGGVWAAEAALALALWARAARQPRTTKSAGITLWDLHEIIGKHVDPPTEAFSSVQVARPSLSYHRSATTAQLPPLSHHCSAIITQPSLIHCPPLCEVSASEVGHILSTR
ncbi:hypothetical protein BJ166DRAFT_577137 [Pestalotiopsis sp. NC0098]|nr:hypothetical protein BJ166DRAFT_577137 [Pestalotiopsis sp. NC0098]